MKQVDIEELGNFITARQAAAATAKGTRWVVHNMGSGGYCIGSYPEGGVWVYWVRPVNGREPSRFASLDTVSAWLKSHAGATRFEVHEVG